MTGRKRQAQHVLPTIGILILAAWCSHWPLISAPFLVDDEALALSAAGRARQGKLLGYFGPAYWRREHDATKGLYRPVREIVFGAVTLRWGPTPRPFHVLNLIMHSLNTVLLFVAARAIVGRRTAAFLGALLFAVHSAPLEAVGFAKNFAELTSVTFALAGLCLFIRAIRPGTSKRGRAALIALTCVSYVLGLLMKETACTLPALLCLAALGRTSDRADRRRALLASLPCWAALAAYVLFYALLLRPAGQAGSGTEGRLFAALATLAFYARFVLLPFPHSVGHSVPVASTIASMVFVRQALIVGAVAAVLIGLARRWPRGALFALWAPIAVAPFANLVATSGRLVGEQRLYWPSIGVCVLLGCAGQELTGRSRPAWARRTGVTVFAVLFACLAAGSFARSSTLASGLDFARRELRLSPEDPVSHRSVGKAYSDHSSLRRAVIHLERAARSPDANREILRHVYADLGTAYGKMGDPTRAVFWLREALKISPDHIGAHESLGTALLRLRRPRDAIPHLEQAIERAPFRPGPLVNLGQACIDLGDLDRAEGILSRAVRRFPKDAIAHVAMGVLRSKRGDWAGAVEHLEKASRLNPDRPGTWSRLALAYRATGREQDARRAMARAQSLVRSP